MKYWNLLVRGALLLLALAVIYFAYRTELRWFGMALVVLGAVLLYNLFRLIALGPLFAGLGAAGCVISIFIASKYKFWLTGRRLHPYDIYTYANLDSLLYFKELYPKHYIYLYVGLAAVLVMALTVLAIERFRRPTRANVAIIGAILLAAIGLNRISPYLDGRGLGDGNRFMHFDHQHTSTFVLTTVLSVPQLLGGNIFEYGTAKALDSKLISSVSRNDCSVNEGVVAPNIIVVLRESITPPSLVKGMGTPQPAEDKFRSFDGRTYPLRVETYGAGSAHTIFSLISGLSTEAFGGLKNLAIDMTPGRLRHTLPLLMRACGYRTAAITTGTEGYVAAREFYNAVGFESYTDLYDVTKLSGDDISDRAIYRLVTERLSKEDASVPNFVYVDTTASHAPYTDMKLRPEEHVEEADSVRDPAIAEYIRRLVIGERDLERFAASFRSGAGGNRPLVILDFGDHQPQFTKDLPGHPGYVNEDRTIDDPHLITYFRIREWGGYRFEALPDHKLIDVAFLSDWLLHALGFHVDGTYAYRWSLVEKCRSRYWQCEDGAVAHELHQLLRAAKFVQFR